MKKNLLFKWVAVLGAVLLLTNTALPGLQVFADSIDNPTENPDCSLEKSDDSIVELTFSDSTFFCKTLWWAAQKAYDKPAVITLLKDTVWNWMVVWKWSSNKLLWWWTLDVDQDLTINFNNHTYTIDKTVWSAGTQTNGFQMLKGSKVVLKNWTLESTTASIILQNYNDLTLENMIINSLKSSNVTYASSNNCWSMTVKGNSEIYASDGGVAFDLWYWMSDVYDDWVTVVFDDDFVWKVEWKIEYWAAGRKDNNIDWMERSKLSINWSW